MAENWMARLCPALLATQQAGRRVLAHAFKKTFWPLSRMTSQIMA